MPTAVTHETNRIDENTVAKLFGKSKLTVAIWRRKHGLPATIIGGGKRNTIRYEVDKVIAWGRENKKEMYPVEGVKFNSNGELLEVS